MNVYCVECGCRLSLAGGHWGAVSGQSCTVGASFHVPDPLDVALRRLNLAKDRVRDAKSDVHEAQVHYDYLKAVRVKRATA